MKKLTIGNNPLTNTIYGGTLIKGASVWSADKQDVTIDALSAVIEHCMTFQDRNDGDKVVLSAGDTKYVLSVEVIKG